jgi:iron complex outermembrane receptor protein
MALIYSPFRRTTLKVLYGRAFRIPNNYELYYHDDVSQKANPGLGPERITTSELVWQQELSGGLRLTADGFDNRIGSLIKQQTDEADGLMYFANSGAARSRGIEVELAGRTLKGIEGRFSYSYQKTADAVTGISQTNSPRHLAKGQVIWPLAHRRVFVGADLQYMSSRTALSGSEVWPYTIVNFTLSSREFWGGIRLSGSVYNVFNNIYSDPVGAEIQSTVVQQNGRDFRVKLSRTFHFK